MFLNTINPETFINQENFLLCKRSHNVIEKTVSTIHRLKYRPLIFLHSYHGSNDRNVTCSNYSLDDLNITKFIHFWIPVSFAQILALPCRCILHYPEFLDSWGKTLCKSSQAYRAYWPIDSLLSFLFARFSVILTRCILYWDLTVHVIIHCFACRYCSIGVFSIASVPQCCL